MVMMLGKHMERLVGSLKSKLRSKKAKKQYVKVMKTESMRMDIRSRQAQKLIAETLKVADSPGRKSCGY